MERKKNKPRVISLFSGCGGMDIGFHKEGYETVWANDISESAAGTYRKNIGEVMKEGDIREVNPYTDKSIPECDLLIGGFPCQDFSIIWKRPGIEGKRGLLYRHLVEFADAKKPKVIVAENVKGLLTANKGKAIERIIEELEGIEPGYTVSMKVYNFAEYGVPQYRERLIIVGVRKDIGGVFEHPEGSYGKGREKAYVTSGEALAGVERVRTNNELIRCTEKTRKRLEMIPEGGNYADIPKGHELYVKGMMSNIYRRLHRKEPSKTVIAAGGGGTWGYHYSEPRPLTNRERARLQTFPDDFEFTGSITEVRRQIGNAVPPEGVRPIARKIMELM